MAATLARTVRLEGVTIPAGTKETPELRARITNPRSWSGPSELDGVDDLTTTANHVAEPAPTVDDLVEVIEAAVEAAVERVLVRHLATLERAEVHPADDRSAEADDESEPPRGGAGSGKDVWRKHAEGLGITVPADAEREDIIALVDAHKAAREAAQQ